MREGQHCGFRERSTYKLEADRQAGSCKTAGNGYGRQPKHIKGDSIANTNRGRVCRLRDCDRWAGNAAGLGFTFH